MILRALRVAVACRDFIGSAKMALLSQSQRTSKQLLLLLEGVTHLPVWLVQICPVGLMMEVQQKCERAPEGGDEGKICHHFDLSPSRDLAIRLPWTWSSVGFFGFG